LICSASSPSWRCSRSVGARLDQDTAAEIDAEIETLDQEQPDRSQDHDGRERQKQLAPDHESQVEGDTDALNQGQGCAS
jgi:hypothetical protein